MNAVGFGPEYQLYEFRLHNILIVFKMFPLTTCINVIYLLIQHLLNSNIMTFNNEQQVYSITTDKF